MNVHPQLTSHPKFTLYKRALGQPEALEYLLRLWGHCQTKQLSENWGPVSEAYVEAICGWAGKPGKLFAALCAPFCDKPGWIHHDAAKNVIITAWFEHNKSLVNSWRNGRTGGRPHGKPTDNPRVHPPSTNGQPMENLIGLDGRGQDGRGIDAHANLPEVAIPTIAEIIDHGRGPSAIPEEFCRHYHNKKSVARSWVTSRGVLIDWKLDVQSWWTKDRHTFKPSQKTAGSNEDIGQLQAELDAETDPQKRAELYQKIKNAEH